MRRHAQANGWVDAVVRGGLGIFVGGWVGGYAGVFAGMLLLPAEAELRWVVGAADGAMLGAVLGLFWFLADCRVPWRRRRRRRTVTP